MSRNREEPTYVPLGEEYGQEDKWWDARTMPNFEIVRKAMLATGRKSLRFKNKSERALWNRINKLNNKEEIPTVWIDHCIKVFGDINRRSPKIVRSFAKLGKWITNLASMDDWLGERNLPVEGNTAEFEGQEDYE